MITNFMSSEGGLKSGGTISGDVTITGDLTVQGSATNTYDEQIQGLHHVYVDDTTLFQSIIEQDGTGDAALKFDLTGARSWLIGLDNSDGDAFKICADANDLKDSTAITIDTNLNVGFGATPTTFHSSLTGVQIGGNGILQHETSAGASKTFKIAQNVREEITSGDFTYISTDEASLIELNSGGVNVKTAPSGTAGATATMTSRFTILEGGNVGIGTTSPAVSGGLGLDIEDTGASGGSKGGSLTLGSNDGSAVAQNDRLGVISFRGAEDGSGTMTEGGRIDVIADSGWSATENGADMRFFTTDGNASDTEKMRITAEGYVNIGQASSAIQATGLHVAQGGAGILGNVVIECSVNATTGPTLHFAKSRGSVGSKSAINTAGGDILGSIVFTGYDGAIERYGAEIQAISVATSSQGTDMPADLAFFTTPDGTASVVERMRIDDAGNVGIGTSSPASDSRLHLYSATHGTDLIQKFQAENDSGTVIPFYMRLDPDADTFAFFGDVDNSLVVNAGTGVVSVAATLEVGSSLRHTGDTDNAIIFGTDTQEYYTGGVARLKLENYSQISLSNNDGNTYNTVLGYKALTNNGTVLGNVGADYNVAVGHEAMGSGNTTDATLNTAVGYLALRPITSGDENTAVGGTAGQAITTGSYNTAIGSSSLVTEDVGNGTTAIGYASLNKQNTASSGNTYNTAVGANAGYYNVTGTGNTLIGMNSGLGADGESHSSNTAVGLNTLRVIETGSENVSIGKDSMYDANTASGVVAVGTESAYNITSGSESVAIGKQALYTATTVGANTAVGYQALKLSTAASNTAVGHSALAANATGTNNIAIGKGAIATADGSESSMIAIGADALGNMNNDSSSQNMAIGVGAMDGVGTIVATNNIMIGLNAGGGTWTGSTSDANVGMGNAVMDAAMDGATFNTAVGHVALSELTTGGSNTAIGAGAGDGLTTAHRTVIIGQAAGSGTMITNSGGSVPSYADGTIAVGHSALAALTIASGNIAIGYEALAANQAGASNLMIGFQAGKSADDANFSHNVGIGNYVFDGVASGVDAQYNTAIGYASMSGVLTDAAHNNTAVGKDTLLALTAGVNNTTIGTSSSMALTTGSGNTVVGTAAFTQATTQADYNTVVGWRAMNGAFSTADVDNCVAIGRDALQGTLTVGATGVVAIGALALQANTSGANIAIGQSAMQQHTSGTRNIAIGYGAMDGTGQDDSPTSNDNIFIGYDAGGGAWDDGADGTDDSNYNIGIGNYCMDAAMDGALYNTAVGYNSSSAITTGDGNSTFGLDSGRNINSGEKNSCYGHEAGDLITTGTNNTIIGAGSDTSANNGTNQTVIGYGATGVRDNSVKLGNSSVKTIVIPEQCAIGGSSYTTMADDATITVIDTNAGACMVYVYDGTSGGGGVFFCTYSDAAVKVAGSSNTAATDSDGNLCVYKSTSSHDVIVKNRLGASRNISIIVVGAQPNP